MTKSTRVFNYFFIYKSLMASKKAGVFNMISHVKMENDQKKSR